MEFRTSTFKKDGQQSRQTNSWLIYALLVVIFLLLAYLLEEMGFSGWPIGVLLLIGVFCGYLIQYHDWGKKEEIMGILNKSLVITSEEISLNGMKVQQAGLMNFL